MIGDLGYLGDDGNLYVVLPDNTEVDITPRYAARLLYPRRCQRRPCGRYEIHPYASMCRHVSS